jgi:hypothetical protein
LKATYAAWHAAGADPRELRARLALTLSIAGVGLPGRTPVELLQEALSEPLADPALEEALTIRLVLTLVTSERVDEALTSFDRGRQRFELAGLSRAELERAAAHQELDAEPGRRRTARLRFAIADPPPGARLWLSPGPDAPVDASYAQLVVPESGVVEIERALDVAPVRWVLRTADGLLVGSGSATPRAGELSEVAVAPHAARARELASLERRPADGRRRVAMLLLDCADWRVVQYLRSRGDLPVLSALLETGHRAVLDSDPPLTAAALESLVWPERSGPLSTVGVLHRFGVGLAGLSSVGENPLRGLAWLLPEARNLFSVLGAGPTAAANLLFAHGGIDSGRHALVTGPQGRERSVPLSTSARDLDAAERAHFPALAALARERDLVHLRTIAAELDVAVEILQRKTVDLLALRVEPLDILTHAHFADSVRAGQDDGAGLLFSVYRYIDARLLEVHDSLDDDDVLIVMSDHGARTAMEHSRHPRRGNRLARRRARRFRTGARPAHPGTSRCSGLSDRQLDAHAGAAARGGAHRHLTPVPAHDLVGDGKPQTGALAHRLGGEEGIEDPLEHLAGDPAAVVFHRHHHSPALALAAESNRAALVHGLGRVHHEIEEDLLQLLGRTTKRRHLVVCALDASASQLGTRDAQHRVE